MARPEPTWRGGRRALAAVMALVSFGGTACLGAANRVYEDGTATDASVASDSSGGGPEASSSDTGFSNDVVLDTSNAEAAAQEAGIVVDSGPDVQSGQVYSCGGNQVTSCTTCGTTPIDCIFCSTADGGHPGVCGSKSAYCQSSEPPGASVCNCLNAGQCVAPFQVCSNIAGVNYCQTCGELGSSGHPCKGGGTCNETTGACN
jgi:hypothetical protein